MRTTKLLLNLILILGFGYSAIAAHLEDHILVSGKMTGSQEVPAVITTAVGITTITINSTRDTICLNATVTGLSGPISGIHIHEGAPGENGSVLIDLTPYVSGNRLAASLSGADLPTGFIAKLLSGELYINAHTASNPNGEIRAQLAPETDWSFSVALDGAQEVPSVSTSAYGVAVFNLSKDMSWIKYSVVTQGLSGAITGAHLHGGAMGVNGAVVVNLTNDVNGNLISGVIMSPSADLIDSLVAGKIYLNVHTANNAGGEIRGQLWNSSQYLYFDASLTGSQEVPAVSTSAMGVATIKLNTSMDTLWYDIAADGLSGAITGAHFHEATLGNNGGVVISLTNDINGNRITGMATGSSLTQDFISDMLSGAIYLNLHTANNPNGEIRGQVYRLLREGYTLSIDGMQEVPSVSTTAMGSGMVSIDRDQDNAHFMMVVDGLSPNAMHFHNGVAGETGSVLYTLTPFYADGGLFGYWRSSDGTPFTTANSVQFRNDSVYANFHTVDEPNGEIRGQVLRGFQCFSITTGVGESAATSDEPLVSLYPNPANELLNVNINSSENTEVVISVMDVLGKELNRQRVLAKAGNNILNLDLSSYPEGIYFLDVKTDTERFTKRFIKQ